MNKTIKKLTCFILALSFLGGMHFIDMAKATTYPTVAFYNWFEPEFPDQYVTVRANCDNYYGGNYYATAYCTDYATNSGCPNVIVVAPSKKPSGLSNYGTLPATVLHVDEYDMKYMSSSVYNGAYVIFRGTLNLCGTPFCTIGVEVRG